MTGKYRAALTAVSAGLIILTGLDGCASTPEPENHHAHRVRASRYPANSVDRADSRSQQCMALAMYWEARGEGRRGMLAVGSVVLNRVEDHRFPDTVCGVIHQGGETPPCQFSWWCDGKSDRPTHYELWATSLDLADELLTKRTGDPTDGALFFHNTSIRPPWRRERTARIGHHVFYR